MAWLAAGGKISPRLADIKPGVPLVHRTGSLVVVEDDLAQASGTSGLDCLFIPGVSRIWTAVCIRKQQPSHFTPGHLFSLDRVHGVGDQGETALLVVHYGRIAPINNFIGSDGLLFWSGVIQTSDPVVCGPVRHNRGQRKLKTYPFILAAVFRRFRTIDWMALFVQSPINLSSSNYRSSF